MRTPATTAPKRRRRGVEVDKVERGMRNPLQLSVGPMQETGLDWLHGVVERGLAVAGCREAAAVILRIGRCALPARVIPLVGNRCVNQR